MHLAGGIEKLTGNGVHHLFLLFFGLFVTLTEAFIWPEETNPKHSIISRSRGHRHGLSSLLRQIALTQRRRRHTAISSSGGTADCRVDPFERLECGSSDLTREECSSRGCCWQGSNLSGVPWCFHSVSNSRGACAVEPSSRTDCGFYGVTSEKCRRMGCCWSPTQVAGAPWCFYTSDRRGASLER